MEKIMRKFFCLVCFAGCFAIGILGENFELKSRSAGYTQVGVNGEIDGGGKLDEDGVN